MGELETIQFLEGQSQAPRFAEGSGREIVGDLFALVADAPRQPPDHRVIEQQRFDRALHQIDEIIVSADMRQFVRDQRFEQFGRQPRHQCTRYDDDRSQPTRGDRAFDAIAQAQAHLAPQSETFDQAIEAQLPETIERQTGLAADAADPGQADQHAQAQQADAERPGDHDPGQSVLQRGAQGLELHGLQLHGRCVVRDDGGNRRRQGRLLHSVPDLRGRNRHAECERDAGNGITRLWPGIAQRGERDGRGEPDQGALPDEMQQGPAQDGNQRVRIEAHGLSPLSSFWISSRSLRVTWPPRSAAITRSLPEPAKAFWIRSFSRLVRSESCACAGA